MSAYPRRSSRLSPHLAQDSQARSLSSNSTPSFSFSQPSSTSTTSHPSPTTNSLNPPPPPPTPQQPNLRLQAQNNFSMAQQTQLNAPLPSPSANNVNPFFGRPHSQPNAFGSQQSAHTSSPFDQQGYGQQVYGQQEQAQQQQFHAHTNSMSQPHPRTMNGMNTQLPPDFLAEAAKRAQIACLMRDLGDVTL